MKKIKSHIYTNTLLNSQILKTSPKIYEKNMQKYFSPQGPNNKFTYNKKIFFHINKKYQSNIEIPAPLTYTANYFYKIKNRYAYQKQNKLIKININNNITIDKLAKKRQNRNSNKNITISNSTNYLKTSQTQRYLSVSNINNYSLSEYNNKKEKQTQKDYTNFLIEKNEIQYPSTTYYFPTTSNNILSPFNKVSSTPGKNINSVRNKKIDISILQKFNSQNNYFFSYSKEYI